MSRAREGFESFWNQIRIQHAEISLGSHLEVDLIEIKDSS